jgi:hypothetical protein
MRLVFRKRRGEGVAQWREGESATWQHNFNRYETMAHQEVGDGSVWLSWPDG